MTRIYHKTPTRGVPRPKYTPSEYAEFFERSENAAMHRAEARKKFIENNKRKGSPSNEEDFKLRLSVAVGTSKARRKNVAITLPSLKFMEATPRV